jgi:hypothetical protein
LLFAFFVKNRDPCVRLNACQGQNQIYSADWQSKVRGARQKAPLMRQTMAALAALALAPMRGA